MRIDIARGGNIAVPEPLLNVLQRHPIRIQKRRAAVPEIVEANAAKAVMLQKTGNCVMIYPGLMRSPISLT